MKYVWIVTSPKAPRMAFASKDHIYASMDITYSAKPSETPKATFISASEIHFSDGTQAHLIPLFHAPTHL